MLANRRRRVDVVFGPSRVAVMVDGCFWHGCSQHGVLPKSNTEFWREKIEANRARDRDTDAALVAAGWYVVRVWEHDDPAAAAEVIARVVNERRPEQRRAASPEEFPRVRRRAT